MQILGISAQRKIVAPNRPLLRPQTQKKLILTLSKTLSFYFWSPNLISDFVMFSTQFYIAHFGCVSDGKNSGDLGTEGRVPVGRDWLRS